MVISMKHKNNRGFTFVELIVVVVILSIVSASAMTGFSAYRESGRTRASERIISCIDYARAVAQTSNYETYIRFYYTDDNLKADVYTADRTGASSIKETYKICGSEYTLYYKGISDSDYSALDRESELQLDFNKSTSGFKESGYVKNLIIDNDSDSEIMLIKETGRAFKVDGI